MHHFMEINMIGFRYEAPDSQEEQNVIIRLAITLARAQFGEPTEAQVRKVFIRLLLERASGSKFGGRQS